MVFDILGTGSHSNFELTAEYRCLPLAIIRHLIKDSRINANRNGYIDANFGGNAALKISRTAPELVYAVVNLCGPQYSAFRIGLQQIGYIEELYIDTLMDRTDTRGQSPEVFFEKTRKFSLVDQGVLVPGEVTTDKPTL